MERREDEEVEQLQEELGKKQQKLQTEILLAKREIDLGKREAVVLKGQELMEERNPLKRRREAEEVPARGDANLNREENGT